MMDQFTSSFLDELEKVAERKRSSKKKRAAGISAGATSGAMMGAPAGLLAALALMARKPRRYKINPPKGAVAQLKYFRGGGFARDLRRVQRDASKKAVKGLAAGAGGGALVGGLAGHEVSKHAAALKSRLTPQSSSVRGFSYDPKSQSLLITYKSGGTYRYSGVPPAVARSMGRSKSVGKAVHRRVKQGGYQYEKVGAKIAKSYTCKFCKEKATKGVIWAEGRAIVPACDKHLGKAKASISEKPDTIRDLTKTSMVRERIREGGKVATMIKEAPKKKRIPPFPRGLSAKERFVLSRGGSMQKKAGFYGTPSMIMRPGLHIAKRYARRGVKGARKLEQHNEELAKLLHTPIDLSKLGQAGYGQVDGHSAVPDELGEGMVELPVPQLEEPVSKRVIKNLAAKAEKTASPIAGIGILEGMTQRRRQIAKMAGAAKKQVTWNGLTMKLELEAGDTRFKGTPGQVKMKDHYGYMPGTYGKGHDGDAIDVYVNPNPTGDQIFRVTQIDTRKKKLDEYKYMVGYGSLREAEKAYKRNRPGNMPPEAYGGIRPVSMNSFRRLTGQTGKKP